MKPAAGAVLLAAVAVTGLVFLVQFARVGFGVYGDGLGYFAPLRSLIFDGDLKVSNEFRHFTKTPHRWNFQIPIASKYPLGLALVLAPFFLLAHGAALLLGILGVPMVADGLSWPYEFFYCGGSVLLGVWGLFFCYRGAKAAYGEFPALLAVIGVWFASPLSYYLMIETSMSHAVSQFLVSAFLFAVTTGDWARDTKRQILLGALLGLAALVRPQDGLFLVVPLLLLFRRQGTGGGPIHLLKPLAVMGGTAALCLLPQAILYRAQFGSLDRHPYLLEGPSGAGGFHWLSPKIFSALFSGFHGLFTWHPLTFLAVCGLFLLMRDGRETGLPLLAGFLAQVYVVAAWWCWWQGASLGGRMFASSSYVFVMGLAALWSSAKDGSWRMLGVLVTLVLMLWNALLVMQYMSGMIPSGEPVAIGRLAANQLKVIPFFLSGL